MQTPDAIYQAIVKVRAEGFLELDGEDPDWEAAKAARARLIERLIERREQERARTRRKRRILLAILLDPEP